MRSLSWEHQLCDIVEPAKALKGLDAKLDSVLGSLQRWRGPVAALRRDADRCAAHAATLEILSDTALQARMAELRILFRRKRQDPGILLEALATVREAAARTLKMRPFLEQLMGVLALHRGVLAEMATGEGKSLTAAVAGVLGAWSGRPCHVVTVNDYLAERDAERFKPLFSFCGVTAGAVTGEMQVGQRQRGHAAGITYTTSKEIVADFLRDRLCLGELQQPARWMIRRLSRPNEAASKGVVMRGLHMAIVDEADSVLIDEAVTPLIIAGSENGAGSTKAYKLAWTLASELVAGQDYDVDARYREVELLPTGQKRVEALGARLPALWRGTGRQRELVVQALHAREFFHNGKQYVVQEDKVVIVDESTGRLMPMRKWRQGLHQSIEAKEGVEISPLDETLARMSFQRFFRLFPRLSGMTGTAKEARAEFWSIYRLPVVTIPTHRPCQRRDMPDRAFADDESKWEAVAQEVQRVHATARPVLVGTRNVAGSEALAKRLHSDGLVCELLNATRHREEASIIASAGQAGRITIATNMAGRGTDIELGEGVVAMGGLHVIATERHESGRVDRQLYGRAGRQGDPGSAQAFVSARDELLLGCFGPAIPGFLSRCLAGNAIGSQLLSRFVFGLAQRIARKRAFRQRSGVLQMDTWLKDALSFSGSSKQ